MRKLLYKSVLTAILGIGSMSLWAQAVDKSYSEAFITNKEVSIDLDTRHTDVVIETWNKNKVEIEATISIEGASAKRKEEIINNWKFKALGNKNQIEVQSKSEFDNIIKINGDVHLIDPAINLQLDEIVFPDMSIENLRVLDTLNFISPDELNFPSPVVFPEFDAYHFSMDSMPFDFEKFKKDEKYLQEWQAQLKEKMEEMKLEWQEQSKISKENAEQLKQELKRMQEDRQKVQEERNKRMVEFEKQRAELNEQRATMRKEMAKVKREVAERKREELAQRRVEVKRILEERNKVKIKRTLTIKAPKDAKFNMNVKYGTIRFAN